MSNVQMPAATLIYVIEPGAKRRLLHTITANSKWATRRMPNELYRPEVQLEFAKGVVTDYEVQRASGLFARGSKFEIVQGSLSELRATGQFAENKVGVTAGL